jgi:hypothetical protein
MRCLHIFPVAAALLAGCAPPLPGGQAPAFTDPTPAQHAQQFFPIESGVHAVDCQQCHGGSDTFAQVDCTGCHTQATTEPKHAGVGGFQWLSTGEETSSSCLRCHADAQVNRLADHLPWVITPPGTTAGHKHYLVSCLACHPSPRADKPFGQDFTRKDCSACHTQPDVDASHLGRPGYSYATAVCLTCHANGAIP